MGGYCPAGKVECENFRTNWQREPQCRLFPDFTGIQNFEHCPWPLRQVPVEPQFKPISNETAEAVCMSMQRAHDAGFKAALQQCREAVDNVECPDIFRYGIRLALAAISRVREGMK